MFSLMHPEGTKGVRWEICTLYKAFWLHCYLKVLKLTIVVNSWLRFLKVLTIHVIVPENMSGCCGFNFWDGVYLAIFFIPLFGQILRNWFWNHVHIWPVLPQVHCTGHLTNMNVIQNTQPIVLMNQYFPSRKNNERSFSNPRPWLMFKLLESCPSCCIMWQW